MAEQPATSPPLLPGPASWRLESLCPPALERFPVPFLADSATQTWWRGWEMAAAVSRALRPFCCSSLRPPAPSWCPTAQGGGPRGVTAACGLAPSRAPCGAAVQSLRSAESQRRPSASTFPCALAGLLPLSPCAYLSKGTDCPFGGDLQGDRGRWCG